MGLRQFNSAFLVILLLCSLGFGQTQPSETVAEKEKKTKEQNEKIVQLIEQALGETANLRLPQNRAIVYAMSGDMLWKFDDKRARELFRNSAAEIIAANQETDREKRENPNPNLFTDMFDFRGDSRSEILPMIAARDAELALELLIETRPARLVEAIAAAAMPNRPANDMMSMMSPDRMRVSQELALEQQFALLAADENPDRAIKLIKDSLSKGISYNVLPLLQKLHKKDEKKASELAGDVIKKLVDTDLSKGIEEFQVATNFLQFAAKQAPETKPDAKDKPFKFTDAQVKDLANKIANTLINGPKSLMMTSLLTSNLSTLEKLVPEKAAQLRQRKAENETGLPTEMRQSLEQQKMFDPNATPEDLIAQLSKMSEFERPMAYSMLSRKIGAIEDEARAKKLIDQIPDEKTRANMLDQFESARVARTASAGKLDEARKLIGNLANKRTQVQRLVALALDFQRKGGEKDIENAKALMKDAKALTADNAETMNDIYDVMEVVRGYAVVEPDMAFRMFEPIIDRINEHVQASSVLAKYSPQNANFKRGEMVLSIRGGRSDSPLFQYVTQMQMLGKADLDRMMVTSDRFARSDSKAIVKLYVLQGFLKDDKKPSESSPFPQTTMIIQ